MSSPASDLHLRTCPPAPEQQCADGCEVSRRGRVPDPLTLRHLASPAAALMAAGTARMSRVGSAEHFVAAAANAGSHAITTCVSTHHGDTQAPALSVMMLGCMRCYALATAATQQAASRICLLHTAFVRGCFLMIECLRSAEADGQDFMACQPHSRPQL